MFEDLISAQFRTILEYLFLTNKMQISWPIKTVVALPALICLGAADNVAHEMLKFRTMTKILLVAIRAPGVGLKSLFLSNK